MNNIFLLNSRIPTNINVLLLIPSFTLITIRYYNSFNYVQVDVRSEGLAAAIDSRVIDIDTPAYVYGPTNDSYLRKHAGRNITVDIVKPAYVFLNGELLEERKLQGEFILNDEVVQSNTLLTLSEYPCEFGHHYNANVHNTDNDEITKTCRMCGHVVIVQPSRADFLRPLLAGILKNGLSVSNLPLNGKELKLVLDGREIVILSRNANNRNIEGEVALGGGAFLRFDIKGNGSNIKEFRIIQR